MDEDGFIEVAAAGDPAKGDFQCAECGYGVTVHRLLPECPMCRGAAWERVAWSPMLRAASLAEPS